MTRADLEALFDKCYAGWSKGVNLKQPTAGVFTETPMTPMELEARYVATEIGANIYEIAGAAAFAPVRIYNEIQKVLGPLFDAQAARINELLDANNRFEARARAAERVCKAIAATAPSRYIDERGTQPCVYCGDEHPDHKPDCLWLRAKAIAETPK